QARTDRTTPVVALTPVGGEAVEQRLGEEHKRVDALLEQLRAQLDGTPPGPAAVQAEAERLTTELEAHLA
ncbi:hypothetical protein ACFQZU_18385, partial [Streptomonospora algeriensis]